MTTPIERAREVAAEVLDHPEHKAGVVHTTWTIRDIDHRHGLSRLVGALNHVESAAEWTFPNVAVRLAIPVAGDEAMSRVYTARRFWFDDGIGMVEIDFVRHAHPSPTMQWLDSVRVADTIDLLGPRPHQVPATEGCTRSLWLADATALPAVYSLLATWTAPVPVEVVLAVDATAPVDELPEGRDVTITRVEPEPGALLAAARQRGLDHATSVWAGGERNEMRALRLWARDELGLDPAQLRIFGYWSAGKSGTDIDAQRIIYYKQRIDQGYGLSGVDDLDIPD